MASDIWQDFRSDTSCHSLNDGTDFDKTAPVVTQASFKAKRTSGFCWSGVNIPQGSTINSADFRVFNLDTGPQILALIVGFDVDDADPLFDGADTPGDRAISDRTGNSTPWEQQFFPGNVWRTSPDITNIVQEIVNRPGYAGDGFCLNMIGGNLLPKWTGTFHTHKPGGAGDSPQLRVNWTPPAAEGRIVSIGQAVKRDRIAYAG